MEEMELERPDWLLPRGQVDEVCFVQEYLFTRAMVSWRGNFYTLEGRISDEWKLRKEIYNLLQPWVTGGLSQKVSSIVETLRLECHVDSLPVQEGKIHLANGTFSIKKGFTTDKEICRCRLPVNYNENVPEPTTWLAFLEELLEEQDIYTLQEYMGYCLLPVTIAQKMLIIIGNGGEGKSRIGVVMKAIFSDSLGVGSLNKVEVSPFARADLEDLLVFVDDDLKLEALTQTNNLKTIITCETPMDLERKGIQSYQAQLHTRLIAFGNSNLQAMNDRSHGFFRRQIILTTKPRKPDRVDDPFLARKMIREKDGIFMWAMAGLFRLIGCNYRFSISENAQANLQRAILQSDNVTGFLKSRGYIAFDPEGRIPSKVLYECYRSWCADNGLTALNARSFSESMNIHAQEYGLNYTNNVPIGGGRYARGFRGLRLPAL